MSRRWREVRWTSRFRPTSSRPSQSRIYHSQVSLYNPLLCLTRLASHARLLIPLASVRICAPTYEYVPVTSHAVPQSSKFLPLRFSPALSYFFLFHHYRIHSFAHPYAYNGFVRVRIPNTNSERAFPRVSAPISTNGAPCPH
jgi:hypothetical protein